MKAKFKSLILIGTLTVACSAAALGKESGTVFISSEKDNVITVLDGKTHQQIAVIDTTCKRPRHMQLTNDRERLITLCGDDGSAVIIDVASKKVVDKIKLQEGAEMFDLSPDGKTLYFTNEDEAQVVFVDLSAKKVSKEIKVAEEPEGILATPDGKTLYVTSEVASLVHVIDVADGKVIKNIPVGKRPRRFALTPNGQELWVTNELGHRPASFALLTIPLSERLNSSPRVFGRRT